MGSVFVRLLNTEWYYPQATNIDWGDAARGVKNRLATNDRNAAMHG